MKKLSPKLNGKKVYNFSLIFFAHESPEAEVCSCGSSSPSFIKIYQVEARPQRTRIVLKTSNMPHPKPGDELLIMYFMK